MHSECSYAFCKYAHVCFGQFCKMEIWSNKAISPPVANLLATSQWPVSLVSANRQLTIG